MSEDYSEEALQLALYLSSESYKSEVMSEDSSEEDLQLALYLSSESYKSEAKDKYVTIQILEKPLKELFGPLHLISLDQMKVLLLGEGDFSFVRSFLESYHPSCHILATTDMSYGQLIHQYPKAEENLFYLMGRENIEIQLEINATRITTSIPGRKFHCAVWNFPCDSEGLRGGEMSITRHKELLLETIREAAGYLFYNGQMRITLKCARPYLNWIEDLTYTEIECPYGIMSYIGTIPFNCENYPGYQHVTTFSKVKPKNIMTQCATHVWIKRESIS